MASFLDMAGIGSKKKKQTEIRLAVVEVDLFPPTADKFPRFHLPTLIKEQTGIILDDDDENPLEDNEEYQKLEAIASKFEEKYGSQRDKKGRKIKFGKPEDHMDLGMGYDLEDSFIDDSAAYDELVPSTLEPIHGGFYVNKGPLEFREIVDSSDEEESTEQPKKKTPRTAPVLSSPSSESTSESDEEPSNEEAATLNDINGNNTGTATTPKQAAQRPVSRNKGQISKVGRPSMTPKQKASANLLKSSKGWARKNLPQSDKKRTESFYGRVSDVVDSVIDAVRPVQLANSVEPVVNTNLATKPAEPSKSDLRIESVVSAVSKPAGDNGTKQKAMESTSIVATPTHSTGLDKGETGNGQKGSTAKKPPISEPKAGKSSNSPRSSPEVTVVKELPAPQSAPRLTGKPPTGTPKSAEVKDKWPVPLHLQKLNDLLVERAKEGGQLCFSSRTDVILRKIMGECKSLGYNEDRVQAVLGDLSGKLRVHRNKIISRWERIKDLRADQSGRKSNASGSSSVTSSTGTPASVQSTPSAPPAVRKSTEASSETSTPSQVDRSIKKSIETSSTPSTPSKKSSDATTEAVKKPNEVSPASTNIATLLELLRQEIDRQMPVLEQEHRKLAEEVALKKLELIQNPGAECERQKNVYTPRRKYAWNDYSKNILNIIVAKVMKHVMGDQSFVDKEEALRKYLEQQVVPLWPSGWMNARELIKESRGMYSREFKIADDDKSQIQAPKASESVHQSPKPAPGQSTVSSTVAKAVNPGGNQPSVSKTATSASSATPPSSSSTFRIPTAAAAATPTSAPSTARVMTSQLQSASSSSKLATSQMHSASTMTKMAAQGTPPSSASRMVQGHSNPSQPSGSGATRPSPQVQTGPQALAASALKLGSQTQTNPQSKARLSSSPATSSSSTSPLVSPQRLGFSIHNLTSSSMATPSSVPTSAVTSGPTIARTWSASTAAMDEAQKQRAQMELALIMAAAGQAHPNPHQSNATNPWFPRQQ